MTEKTFTLGKTFGEAIFNRFLEELQDLKVHAAEPIEIFNRVTADDLITLIESAFWASLTVEEGRYHAFRISFAPPDIYPESYHEPDYLFLQPKPYSPDEI